MEALVVDTSVAFKWFRREGQEPAVPAAMAVLERHLQGQVLLHAPDLLVYEFGNILKVRSRQSGESPARILDDLFRLELSFHRQEQALAREALQLALVLNVTFYDASFVALAGSLNAGLVTADARLYRAVKDRLGASLIE